MLRLVARIDASLRGHPWSQSVLPLALCALLVGNWLAPVGLRLQSRTLNAPALFGGLLLLSIWSFFAVKRISAGWRRRLLRALVIAIWLFAILAGCTSLVLRVDVLPLTWTTFGSDRMVASSVAGGAVGPHYTEFRQERTILPGLVLARLIGSSDYVGDVTMSFPAPQLVRATIADTTPGSPHVFEAHVSPLLPW